MVDREALVEEPVVSGLGVGADRGDLSEKIKKVNSDTKRWPK
ncbi:hypothetical protein [Streptomyces sp. 769]|nr:hypothetical protein [Streptomyces sp. 769]